MAGPGIGKTTLTEAITERLAAEMIVVQIHGSSSLSRVPFGILAPYTAELTAEDSVSPVAVLRSVWSYFEKLKAGKDTPLLLMMDDAHHLDEATASIVADMISAGWASVVAAGRPRPGLPQPLAQLWYDGLADRVDLRPLNREQIEEVLAHALDGTIPAGTVDTIWSASGGNPRVLDALLHDAAEGGQLAKRNGIWMLLGPLPAEGPRLTNVVVKDMLRRAPEEQEALKLIALAGPVSRKVIEDISGAEIVRSLLDQQMVVESQGTPADLRIWNAMFGQALRKTISVSRSLQLLEKIQGHLRTAPGGSEGTAPGGSEGTAPGGSEGRLRAVEWALECGLKTSEPELLEAAGTALDHFRNRSSWTMAAKVANPAIVPQAKVIQARALYNEGDYAGAAKLLDGCWLQLGSGASAAPALMLRAMVHQALGTPLAVFAAESREALRSFGAEAGAGTQNEADAQADSGEEAGPVTAWQEQLLRLLELGDAGNCEALDNEVQDLRSRNPGTPTHSALCAVGAALLAHALAASGRSVQGLDAALLAASELPALEGGIFFFNEFVLGRLVADYLAMGDWESAERELVDYTAAEPRAAEAFGGSLQVLRGYSLLRQGRIERAYQTLLPAVETLRLNDPLQLFRFGSSLAFYVASRLGDAAQSSRLELDYKDSPQGTASQEILATAYAAAGSEYVTRDGKGLAALHTLATIPEVSARSGTLLELLALCWDLGDHSVIPLVHSLAGNVEGRWAAAMFTLADHWESADADSLMETAARLEAEGFVNVAREAYARASSVLEAAGERRRSRQAVALREKCDHELGERFREGQFIAAAPTVRLTRREQDIVELAVQGLTDRDIAQRLMVSVRTVEGHLYRTYVKLGVRSRDELSTALAH
ncbi:DNA-binding CsgD family transcriptional regulator/type II secretory pathway predicted ATPase ExeA/tetratricopeptide (TPR) repeat protein [Pseudarthrobacter sulfonivorans]|nr:LuxR C-terminal-related transcriptional regulator [Pseudarthrobacter sulfonivorans]MDR6416121.1 DNA-binding CsgD family transcriptional regulator/type II secretory pathway predicted ATPase ExeA/tetratricopeptide (TPR) repeat protein [Pseudarthrobacter sulfonivorans]